MYFLCEIVVKIIFTFHNFFNSTTPNIAQIIWNKFNIQTIELMQLIDSLVALQKKIQFVVVVNKPKQLKLIFY